MELLNTSRMVADFNVGLEPSGAELLVVAIKGTFVLPRSGEPVRLADEQVPLLTADAFNGKPGESAASHEIDFAARKRMCDVLLFGSACAPEGRQATRLRVGLQVGAMHKSFDVLGDRQWQAGPAGISASEPLPFQTQPVSYDVAFGGVDRNSPDAQEHDAYLMNPVGRGWHKHLKGAWVDGQPMPNTEETGQPVTAPNQSYRPMAFGPLGRGWPQRARFAGTYDQQWLDNVFPFLPADFDERFYQAAPEDQQLPLPTEQTDVVLSGFTSDGERRFVLPRFDAAVQVYARGGGRAFHDAGLDTIMFEPDEERFTLTWRLTLPLRRSLHEIAQVVVGRHGIIPGRPSKIAAGAVSA